MQISLTPTLTAARKREAKRWLIAQLASPELADATVPMTVSGFVTIYINGSPKMVYNGNWNAQEIGRANAGGYFTVSCGSYTPTGQAPTKPERVAILGGIICALELWDELAEQYSQAMGRTILESYQSCCLEMVQAPKMAVKLAFSADKQQSALQYADEPDVWYLNNGEPVKVDDTWHQIAA